MFYQNILNDVSPYRARVGSLPGFDEHRHADIEINYCIKGSFEVVINKKKYTVNEGELCLISPMAAHSFPYDKCNDREVLTIIVGVSFLKNFFSYFSHASLISPVITNSDPENSVSPFEKLQPILAETAELCTVTNTIDTKNNDLLIRGNLYKICSYLIDIISISSSAQNIESKEMIKVANIEKALQMIYYDYAEHLTVEYAAEVTGYGKSNFCKVFKKITGDTFHNVLNKQRVECACGLLAQTDLSISEIAVQVGFAESKTFCRIFKSITDQTPGNYRKNIHKHNHI